MNYRLLVRTGMMALPLVAGFGIAAFVFAAEGKHEGYTDTPMLPGGKWHVHDPARPNPPIVTPGKTFSQRPLRHRTRSCCSTARTCRKWIGADGATAEWKMEDGYMERPRGSSDEGRVRRLPAPPRVRDAGQGRREGQGRGNNGMNIYGQYEIQVLDSYENVTYADGGAPRSRAISRRW